MGKSSKSSARSREQYSSLQPRVKNVNETAIRKKWKKLPESTQSKAAELLRTMERPGLARGGYSQKQIDAQVAVGELVESLVERLPRMPFPPGVDDTTFDFETTMNRHRTLEDKKTTNLHTTGLLRAELDAETEMFEEEKTELEQLRKELMRQQASSDEERRRLHPILRDCPDNGSEATIQSYDARPGNKAPEVDLSALVSDPAATDVLKQLHHHLDSIETNVEGMHGIATTLSKSQAVLDVFNWRRLEPDEYRRVYKIGVT